MQEQDWSDYRIFLAVCRAGTYAGAAGRLAVDETTVSRRMARFQRRAGQVLLRRGDDGRLLPTPEGLRQRSRAEAMERLVAGPGPGGPGSLRITAVPWMVNRVLTPALPELLADFPELTVELVPQSRDLSLTRREADIALRLGRPAKGGTQVLARRLPDLPQSAYADHRRGNGWITYDESLAHLPQARFSEAQARREGAAPVRVQDAETALQAAVGGLGIAVLPDCIAAGHPGLWRLDVEDCPPRELWLLVSRDLREVPHVAGAVEWLAGLFAESRPGSQRAAVGRT